MTSKILLPGKTPIKRWVSQAASLCGPAGDPTTDPYFANVVLLMHSPSSGGFVDTTGRHTFVTNGAPAGPTLVADHTFSTQTKCGLNVRATAQYLTLAGNLTDFSFGTGDFTIEMLRWGMCPYSTATGPGDGLFSTSPFGTAGAPYGIGLHIFSNRFEAFENAGGGYSSIALWTLPNPNASGWNSLAFQRASGVMSFYHNGVLGTKTAGAAPENRDYTRTTTPSLMLQYSDGSWATTGGAMDGYFTEIRITKGVARYSGNYLPRTTPFPDSA